MIHIPGIKCLKRYILMVKIVFIEEDSEVLHSDLLFSVIENRLLLS